MLRVALNGFPAALQQLFGNEGLIVQKHLKHLFQRLVGRLGIQLEQQLDAFHRHRREHAGAQAAGPHEDQFADAVGVFEREVQRRGAPHRVADQVRAVDAQRIHQPFDGTGVDQAALLVHDHRVRLVEAGRVLQNHPVAGVDKGADVAVIVAPAASAGAPAMQHDDGFAVTRFVVVNLEIGKTFFIDFCELAGGTFGECCHFLSFK